MSTSFVELSSYERETLMQLFRQNCLYEPFIDDRGRKTRRLMRKRVILILDKKFPEAYPRQKSLQSLIRRKIIVPHLVGYRIQVRPPYVKKIYSLADQGQWELITQLAGQWIEPENHPDG